MNIQKTIAIVAAIAINVAVLAGFHAWSTATVASAAHTQPATQHIVTLPVINVTPSPAQLRELHKRPVASAPEQASVAGSVECLVMPYYSFAAECDSAASG